MRTANSQKIIVLNHLKEHQTISSWEAITKYHITRLSSVIHTLIHKDGYDIRGYHVHNGNSRYYEYKLYDWAEGEQIPLVID